MEKNKLRPEWTEQRDNVFKDRYALTSEEGELLEQKPKQMWRRIATTIGKDKEGVDDLFRALSGFSFVPAGRQLAGVGSGMQSTYFNCYFLPFHNRSHPEAGRDSRKAIMDTMSDSVEIMARGGGVGLNWSTLRPKGAVVEKVHGQSSGTVSWMSAYDEVFSQVEQGGSRRGASMFLLEAWHPDVLDFIEAKSGDENKLNMANISVGIGNDFMEAVKNDKMWQLKFPDTSFPKYDEFWDGRIDKWEKEGYPVDVYEEIPARKIWDKIATNAHKSAEPGIVWLERANDRSNTKYFETIRGTNPCFRGDMKLKTKDGYKRFDELVHQDKVDIVNKDGETVEGEVWSTGQKETVEVTFIHKDNIYCTPDHEFKTINNGTVQASNLKDKQLKPPLNNPDLENETYVKLGFVQGDGNLSRQQSKSHKGIGVNIGEKDQDIAELFHEGNLNSDLRTYYTTELAEEIDSLGFSDKKLPNRTLPTSYDEWDDNEKLDFLKGLYSANGSVIGKSGRGRVTLKTTCQTLANQVKASLENLLNISPYITTNESSKVEFSNGEYECKESYDLNIGNFDDRVKFFNEINFVQKYKTKKLKDILLDLAPTVVNVKSMGEEEVFDFKEPKTHWGVVENRVAHNCSELPLPPYGVCNLGAVNLVEMLNENKEIDWKKLKFSVRQGVKFLDTVIDHNTFVLDQTKEQQKKIRRIGLGTMGLADFMLIKGVKYGSDESLELIDDVFSFIRDEAYRKSAELAEERGQAPAYYEDQFMDSPFVQTLSEDVKEEIKEKGIRNLTLLTQAPTGSTSILAGVSSGIEPNYAWSYNRSDGTGENTVNHWLVDKIEDEGQFVTAKDLDPMEHVKVQGRVQKYIDNSISKTINAPEDHTVEGVKETFMSAYDKGCKGITYFREGSREGVMKEEEEKTCPDCGSELNREEGCLKCGSCGWSKCDHSDQLAV